ncbi:DegV family protein [Lacticigenium naphthae]|uniref:DegV family protein n=1 Tax=Lacticigenium naphthae TaxID=515351 RepID=UPI0004004380|nr:DegV family protein [Lacticigenium naphthae]
MKIAIVTDSTAYLTTEQYEKYTIFKLPLSVILNEKVYKEEVDITAKSFFEQTRTLDVLPTSSQPSVGEMVKLYTQLSKEYDAIISIHLSSEISGTYQNACSVADMLEEINIFPFDSGLTCAAQGFMARTASLMAEKGATVEEILVTLTELKEKTGIYFVVDDLTYLVRGGRLSNAAGAMGTLLKIKPVLTFEEEQIKVFEKIRTKKKALARIEKQLAQNLSEVNYPIRAAIVHANCLEEAKEWKEKLEASYPAVHFEISHFGPVIGVHVGENALGLTWTEDKE